jgi:hypothetical protein
MPRCWLAWSLRKRPATPSADIEATPARPTAESVEAQSPFELGEILWTTGARLGARHREIPPEAGTWQQRRCYKVVLAACG